jgi:hypothetical protein
MNITHFALDAVSLIFFGAVAMAAEDEATLKAQMHKDCAPLFAPGGACADLAKGT